MTDKLAKAYKMLKTCNIKSGRLHVVYEEFEAGRVYATKDVIAATPVIPDKKDRDGKVLRKGGPDDRRLRLWIEMGFCVPAGDSAVVTAVATPDEKAKAKQETEGKRSAATAEAAAKKAGKEEAKLEAEQLKVDAKQAKEDTAEAKRLAAEAEKERKVEEKRLNAEKALEAKEEKAQARQEEKWMKKWKDVPVEDFPKYVALLETEGYEFEDDTPDSSDPAAWLAYFVPFFGEGGPPDLTEAE